MKRFTIAGFQKAEPQKEEGPKWNEDVLLAGKMSAPASLFRSTKK